MVSFFSPVFVNIPIARKKEIELNGKNINTTFSIYYYYYIKMEHIKIFVINDPVETTVQRKYAIMQQLWENDCIADILDKDTPDMFQLIVNDGYMAGLILHDENLYYDTVEHFFPDLPPDWDICFLTTDRRSYLISNYAALKVVQNNGHIDDLLPGFTKYVIDHDKIILDE